MGCHGPGQDCGATLRTIIRSGDRMYEVESDTWFDNRPLVTMRATDRGTGETVKG